MQNTFIHVHWMMVGLNAGDIMNMGKQIARQIDQDLALAQVQDEFVKLDIGIGKF